METGDVTGKPPTDKKGPQYGHMVEEFVAALSRKGPVPAAGAAAAAVVAQAAGLGLLAVRVSLSRSDSKRPDVMGPVASDLEAIVQDSIALIDKDVEMVSLVMGTAKTTRERPVVTNKSRARDRELLNEAPTGVVSLAVSALRTMDRALPFIHDNVIGEAGAAAALLHAGARTATLIVMLNDSHSVLARQETGGEIDRLFEKIWSSVAERRRSHHSR